MIFFFGIISKLTHIFFFYAYLNFLTVLNIVNSLKITKTLMYSVLTKMRYKKQNWMQGQHNGKMVDFFNWPKFRLTKSVFFRARAVNRGTHVYPRMSKGYLQPLVLIFFWCHICACKFMHAYFSFDHSRWRQIISGYQTSGSNSVTDSSRHSLLLTSLHMLWSRQVYIIHRSIIGFLVVQEATCMHAHEYRLLGASCLLLLMRGSGMS